MFEVQTVSRNYLCGASTHEEMQSWVGILQTLTQYGRKRGTTTCNAKEPDTKESDEDELSDKGVLMGTSMTCCTVPLITSSVNIILL